ncbi:MAG: 23S rRNA (adenine(2503)-C(2))-methyltransferase RlmN [Gammaproteobacteria bacterium]|nr:23S rRNA (adenine(2503)-C(2))-methyltransferase RlmN [Gammaproteobacteria bacterium]
MPAHAVSPFVDLLADKPQVSKLNLLGLPRARLEEFFKRFNEPAFRATQLVKWVHRQGVTDFDAMTDLSLKLRAQLRETGEIVTPACVTEQASADGTIKWLLRLDDANAIETVFIPEPGRGTLCISSQVGCALDCTFCSTARQGFNRNLSAAEIVGQLWFARRALQGRPGYEAGVTNIVLMGMGEPLLNLDNVVDAMHLMIDDHAYGLGKRKVTLSTSGVVPALDKLKDRIDVSLAVSLHAPEDALRDRLVPLNRKYPIHTLLAACRRYIKDKDRKAVVTFEYVMLDGINDSQTQAGQLARLLRDIPAKVNLIPFNPFPAALYRRSGDAAIDRFRDVLQRHGIVTVTRRTRGGDIDAACGQLAGRVQDRSHRQQHFIRLAARIGREQGATA